MKTRGVRLLLAHDEACRPQGHDAARAGWLRSRQDARACLSIADQVGGGAFEALKSRPCWPFRGIPGKFVPSNHDYSPPAAFGRFARFGVLVVVWGQKAGGG